MKSIFLSLSFLFVISLSSAQSIVDWKYDAKKISSDIAEVTFTATVQDGWYIYSQFLGDEGPIPTTFEFEGVELIGIGTEKGYKKEGFDEVFGMNLIKFGKTVTFTQRVKLTSTSKSIDGYLTYMTCDDEQCLPPQDVEFSIAL
ncbi:MAG: protein-disulfide reductase DsbD domain-containing protein [Bacteroidota bacterium]